MSILTTTLTSLFGIARNVTGLVKTSYFCHVINSTKKIIVHLTLGCQGPIRTGGYPVALGWPQVSTSPCLLTGTPWARTVGLPGPVTGNECGGLPCGATGSPVVPTGAPPAITVTAFAKIIGAPLVLISPNLCTGLPID
jgi:hypothetical protein